MDTKLVTTEVRIQQWAGIIKSRSESGLTIKEYCEANNLSSNQYYYWLRKVKEAAIKEAGYQFVEIPQVDETKAFSSENSIHIQIGSISINVNEGTSRDLLHMVMEVAGDVQ